MRFAGLRIVIVGLARQGIALTRFFCAQGAKVTITDIRAEEELREPIDILDGLPVEYALGGHSFALLDGADLVCLSGGVPPESPFPREARRRGIPLSNDSLLTLYLARAPVVGITGSSGKTTTTTLVGHMLEASGLDTRVGGNIGTPLIDHVHEISPDGRIVLELSSFQLQLFEGNPEASYPPASPHLSSVLNLTPNHLDRHPSMAHYAAAKANILRFQSRDDVAVLGLDDGVTGRWWKDRRVKIDADPVHPGVQFAIRARVLGFSLVEPVAEGAFLRGDRLVWRTSEREVEIGTTAEIQLPGRHNVANMLAACAISGAAGALPEAMREVIATFGGVPHRLELVRVLDDVLWYNDSIATTPERVIAALESFDGPIVLLAGGRDKHLPWDKMAELAADKVEHIVLFGEAASRIAEEIATARARRSTPSRLQVHGCEGLAEAVQLAAGVVKPGYTVLLSPGGTSFDAYRDFEERGECFCSLVWQL